MTMLKKSKNNKQTKEIDLTVKAYVDKVKANNEKYSNYLSSKEPSWGSNLSDAGFKREILLQDEMYQKANKGKRKKRIYRNHDGDIVIERF